jgi:hypothetical protein
MVGLGFVGAIFLVLGNWHKYDVMFPSLAPFAIDNIS